MNKNILYYRKPQEHFRAGADIADITIPGDDGGALTDAPTATAPTTATPTTAALYHHLHLN